MIGSITKRTIGGNGKPRRTRYVNQFRKTMPDGSVVKRCKTFPTYEQAEAWGQAQDRELSAPGALEKVKRTEQSGITIGTVLRWYKADYHDNNKIKFGYSKLNEINYMIKRPAIADLPAMDVTTEQLIQYAQERLKTVKPATLKKDFQWLRLAFQDVRISRGIDFPVQIIKDVEETLKRKKWIHAGEERERRAEIEEVKRLIEYFMANKRSKVPMVDIILFAIFSARRRGEICRITWDDLNAERQGVMVRKMKHPTKKKDTFVKLPPVAWAIVQRQPKTHDRIFPYHPATLTIYLTKATRKLGIENLRLHDFRHEAATILAELGLTPSQMMSVTGHKSMTSLNRYTHNQEYGVVDKWRGFEYLPEVENTDQVKLSDDELLAELKRRQLIKDAAGEIGISGSSGTDRD